MKTLESVDGLEVEKTEVCRNWKVNVKWDTKERQTTSLYI